MLFVQFPIKSEYTITCRYNSLYCRQKLFLASLVINLRPVNIRYLSSCKTFLFQKDNFKQTYYLHGLSTSTYACHNLRWEYVIWNCKGNYFLLHLTLCWTSQESESSFYSLNHSILCNRFCSSSSYSLYNRLTEPKKVKWNYKIIKD